MARAYSSKPGSKPTEGGTAAFDLPVAALSIGDDFRLDDDPDQLAELAASIAAHGVLQPLLVRQVGSAWEVVAGRRRLAAARAAGVDAVPCVLRALSDDEAADVALAENLHRRSLSPIEEALAYARLRSKGLVQHQIAARVGRSQAHVSRLLRVLGLPEAIRKSIHEGSLSYATALKHAGREATGKRQGTSGSGSRMTDDAFALVSYWRRRHDRVLAGLHAMRRHKFRDVDEVRLMLDRLIKVDAQPFDNGQTGGPDA